MKTGAYRLPIGTVSLDDESYFELIELALARANLLNPVREACSADEDTFRSYWRYLESKDCTAPAAEAALSCVLKVLNKSVTDVCAFHGCSVSKTSTYEVEGIKPLSPEWITTEIKRWAGTMPSSDSEAGQLLKTYLAGYKGTVCAVKSLNFHQEAGGYQHALGSETLRNVLQRHSVTAWNSMLAECEPSIIAFRIPVDLLEKNAWPNFVSDMLRIWLSKQVKFDKPRDAREGGIILHQTIPRAFLLRRHVCDKAGKLTGKIQFY